MGRLGAIAKIPKPVGVSGISGLAGKIGKLYFIGGAARVLIGNKIDFRRVVYGYVRLFGCSMAAAGIGRR